MLEDVGFEPSGQAQGIRTLFRTLEADVELRPGGKEKSANVSGEAAAAAAALAEVVHCGYMHVSTSKSEELWNPWGTDYYHSPR